MFLTKRGVAKTPLFVALSDGPILLLFQQIYCSAVSVKKKKSN